jgi:hypothetical protein
VDDALQRRIERAEDCASEVAALIRRVRICELDIEDLGVAAWVAYEPAEIALSSPDLDPEQVRAQAFARADRQFQGSPGDAVVIELDPRGSLSSWLGKLGRMRPYALHRAAAASARAVLAHDPWRESTRAAVNAFEAWILDPSDERVAAVCAFLNPLGAPPYLPGEPHWLSTLLASVSPERHQDPLWAARLAVESCVFEHPEGDLGIRPAIRDEVAAWALDYDDPVLARRGAP